MDAVTQWCKLSEDDEERTGFRASGSEPGLKYCAPKTNGSCFRDRVRSASAKNGATIGTQRDLSIERRIQVTFRHRIFFTREAFSTSNLLLRKVVGAGKREDAKRVLIVLDAALAGTQPRLMDQIRRYFAAHSRVLDLVSTPLLIEGGERVKNSARHLARILSHINRNNLDRHSCVLAIGGGALLDMVGLAASIAHRGMRHVRMPSTTLSQNDSGVGVKNGINAFGKKNFVGTFAPPFAVINDFGFLSSLSARDKRAGYAEAVKVALIRDAGFFLEMEQQADRLRVFEPQAMENVIRRCAELHVEHIATSGDAFERGSVRPLDFGHWSAHKLEQLSNYRIRHGEAVAIGVALDVIYSGLIGLIEQQATERILLLLERLGFDLFAPELLQVDARGHRRVLEGLEEFRQHLGGELTITLLQDMGREITVHRMKRQLIFKAIRELEARQKRRKQTGSVGLAD